MVLYHWLFSHNNGALTKCSRTSKVYDIKKIETDYSLEILRYCAEEGLSVSIYDDDEIFIDKNSENLEIHAEIDAAEPKVVGDLKEVIKGSIIKIMFNSKDKYKLEHHARKLYEMYKEKLNFYFSLPYFVEIVNKEANKRNAMESLSQNMNITQNEIIAIGDNFNDLDMIKYAGLGVVMGNAPQYMKNEADFVTRSNDDDGVRYVLEKFIL